MKKIKVFILSDINSTHTKRWVASLCRQGCEIFLFGLLKCDRSFYDHLPNVTVYNYNFKLSNRLKSARWILGKVLYLGAIGRIKKKIKEFQPDILHAHYASSFGLLGAFTNFHPYIISVWGSDVYSYPKAGNIYKKLLTYSFSKADKILSTSLVMAKEAQQYTSQEIGITPFGVDTSLFVKKEKQSPKQGFIIGNVKSLSKNYGIDVLINAFKIVSDRNPNKAISLQIAGTGPEKQNLIQQCKDLGIDSKVTFLGFIPNHELPAYYNCFDVAVSLSNMESFGVVAIEAMACECPVVTSDAEGFTEIVTDEINGFIVPKQNPEATADAIQKLLDNEELRHQMGQAGREHVLKYYEWNQNVQTMLKYYKNILNLNQ
ncbi:MAG: glycosyltransferase [Bacteroidales bacterium]